ncbi:MAG: PepSY domain-containing protein [Opitutaceae bacterium]|nr:PepSY domain-containing protein [Opitutaceae bacterium]
MRKVFFWLHLLAGLIAGLSIAVMCFTGVVLAFEAELVAWAERDARRVAVPADPAAARLPLAELQKRVREAQPELRSPGITVSADPGAAVVFSAGREGGYYANPYTGEIRQPASTAMHDFMHVMEDWHRVLGLGGDSRPIGKAINGACNLAFLFLAVSGLYLWWPRSWSWRGLKSIAVFNWRLGGKAREFNWHNSIGLWSAPVLIVLTLTAVPISYRWGGNLIYRIVGEEPPAQGGPGGPAGPAVEIARPSPEARPVGYDDVVARLQADHPRWTQITLRSGGGQRGQRAPQLGAASATPPTADVAAAPRGPQALTVTIRESGSWPRTATTTLTLDPFTGEALRRETFSDLSVARQIRSWTRFLHTGQALGWGGQFIAGLACLGGLFLVYTGVALSVRRFFPRRGRVAASEAAGSDVPAQP